MFLTLFQGKHPKHVEHFSSDLTGDWNFDVLENEVMALSPAIERGSC